MVQLAQATLPLPGQGTCARRIRMAVGCLVVLACSTSMTCAVAANPPPATMAMPLRDPWIPPEARPATVPAPLEGAALRAKAESKLKASFDTADSDGSGAITRSQAQAHGLGYIVQHFDAIDRTHSGRVSFDDLRSYMQQRAAQANQLR
jgi:hypothetical protein